MKKWGFAVSATGNIAHRMVKLLSQMDQVYLAAVHSRDMNKAKDFQKQYGFATSYDQLALLAQDPAVDVVYIASPHPMHFEQAKTVLEQGKHVLCEKPITMNATQAKVLYKIAQENHCLLMEAMWTRFLPVYEKVQEMIVQDIIGQITLVEASFGGNSLHVPRIVEKSLGGGAFLDIGTYLMHLAAMFMTGDAPFIQSSATLSPEGVDIQNALIFTDSSGVLGIFKSSVVNTFDNQAVIYGKKGHIVIPRFWDADSFTIYYQKDGKEKQESCQVPHPYGDGFYYEVKAFIDTLEQGLLEVTNLPMEESIRVLKQMDAARHQWHVLCPEDEQFQ